LNDLRRAVDRSPEQVWRKAHLELAQSQRVTESYNANGDLLLLCSSWERRCIEVTRVRHEGYLAATVITFAEEGVSGRRIKHDQHLIDFAKATADRVIHLARHPVSEVERWRSAITNLITDLRRELGRPIDIVADISCLPKYYMLAMLGFGLHNGLIRSLRFLYAEGRYAPADGNVSLAANHSFTEGAWRSLPVPYLEGLLSPDKKVHVIASIGFETFQARKLIRVYEAERHTLITPHPGFSDEYSEQSEREAGALANNLDLGEDAIIKCPAGDATAAAAAIVNLVDCNDRLKPIGLCLGTKPHALGMGLAALLKPDLTVVCRMPDRYVETETPATGITWSYELRDLSVAGDPKQTT